MRALSDDEIRLIHHLATKLAENIRAQLLVDLRDSLVDSEASRNGRLVFQIAGYERPTYRGQHAFPVEARMLDADGSELSVMLYADEHGRLLELEFIRWGSKGEVLGPRWDTLKVW